MAKLFKNKHKFVSAEEALRLVMSGQKGLLQVGQWVANPEDPLTGEPNPHSRIVREEGANKIALHPGSGDGTVCQRFLRAHSLKKVSILDIREPQSVALACQQMGPDDIRKLKASLDIMRSRISELVDEANKVNYPVQLGAPRLVA